MTTCLVPGHWAASGLLMLQFVDFTSVHGYSGAYSGLRAFEVTAPAPSFHGTLHFNASSGAPPDHVRTPYWTGAFPGAPPLLNR